MFGLVFKFLRKEYVYIGLLKSSVVDLEGFWVSTLIVR